ncbi:MAG: hypothetical protein EZS28_049941, partial [Streblomastix strix]
MGMETEQRNSQNETEEAFTSPTRSILFEKMGKDRNRDNSKKNCKIIKNDKLSNIVILRSLTLPEHNGPSESISSKTEKMKASITAQIIQILPQMTMKTDAALSGWVFTLEQELEMIVIAHGTWNKKQTKLTINIGEIKAMTQGLRSFAKVLKKFASSILCSQKRQQYSRFRQQKMEIINIINKENQTGTLNNRKARNIDPDYSPSRSQKRNSKRIKQTINSWRLQDKDEDFSTDMSSDEFEPNNRLIFTTLLQP